MKKTLFLAILAGAALAGCVKNEEVAMSSGGSPERIKFDAPVVSVPTRATEIVGNANDGKYFPTSVNFAVYAHKSKTKIVNATTAEQAKTDGSKYMENVTCTYTTAGEGAGADAEPNEYWNPTGIYYWPKEGFLSFGAYTPVMSHTVPDNSPEGTKAEVEWDVVNGFKFNNFTVKTNPSDQYDLLYSVPAYNQTKDNQVDSKDDTEYDGVQITFKHALSSIVFMAKSEGGADQINLTKIVVKDVYSTGDFSQNYYKNNTTGTAAWTTTGTPTTEYVVYDSAKDTENPDGVVLTAAEAPINGSIDPKSDGTRRSDLIVMPQILNGGADNDGRGPGTKDATVEITYTIKYRNADGAQQTDTPTAKFNLAVVPDKANTPITHQWEIGKRYIYHIGIGMQKIYFNPQVEAWDDTMDGFLEVK